MSQISELNGKVEEVHSVIEDHGSIGVASIATIATCLFLALDIIYRNWNSIRTKFSE